MSRKVAGYVTPRAIPCPRQTAQPKTQHRMGQTDFAESQSDARPSPRAMRSIELMAGEQPGVSHPPACQNNPEVCTPASGPARPRTRSNLVNDTMDLGDRNLGFAHLGHVEAFSRGNLAHGRHQP